MASMLQLLLERPHLSSVMKGCKHRPFKFAIVVSGFEPRDSEKLTWYSNKYPVLDPDGTTENRDSKSDVMYQENGMNSMYLHGVQGASMHVIGRNDVIIEPGRP